MTVISALFTNKGIAVATDSLLSMIDKNGSHIYLEWEQSKIVPVRKYRACISYWGFAGMLKPENPTDEWSWSTFEWLQREASNPSESNLEEFVKNLCEKLKEEYSKLQSKIRNIPGVGLHITGYECIDGYWIPELFLISNYTDTSYQITGELGYSRHTFHTIANVPPSEEHKQSDFRFRVKDHLLSGGMIFYNNGDPLMFNLVASTLFYSLDVGNRRSVIKELRTVMDTIPLVKRPIEIISEIQRDFYKEDKKLVV